MKRIIIILLLATVVYGDGGQILDDSGDDYYISSPFDGNELFDIQYVQIANVMYLVCPNHPPQKLTRTAHNDWSIADVDITTGPFLKENVTDTEVTADGITGTITITADGDIFDEGHEGALWRIGHRKESTSISGSLSTDTNSLEIACGGDYDYNIQGTWVGTVTLERSSDSGSTWGAIQPRYNNDAAINEDYPDTETEDGILYRVTASGMTGGSATYNFAVHDYIGYGVVRISTYTSATEVDATVLTDLLSTDATKLWSEGYWSDYRGWPQTVGVYERRLMFGGSVSYPQTIWASKTASGKTDDYENFTADVDDDDALIYELPGQNPLQWMLAQTYMLMGTSSGVGRWGSADDDTPITPTQPTNYRIQARHGSAYIQAVLVGDAVLYIERGGQKVREFTYNLERDRFVAPDMTILAEHITGDGIVDIAYQSRPDSILWCVREDGDIAALTYERSQDVVGWTRIVTDGDFESVAVIPDMEGGEDKVWVVVKRTIDDNNVRYVEQFQPRDWGDDQSDCFFIDSGLSFDGGDAVDISDVNQSNPALVTVSTWPTDGDGDNLGDTDQIKIVSVLGMTEINDEIYTIADANVSGLNFTLNDSTDTNDVNSISYTVYTSGGTVQRFERDFTNLSHLEGKTVSVLGDGIVQGNEVVSSNSVTVDTWSNKVHIGLPYTSILETMPIVLETQTGITAGKKSRIGSVKINFYKSFGTTYGTSSSNLSDVRFYPSDDTETDIYTGWRDCPFLHGYYRDATIYISQNDPLPMIIRAIIPKLEVTER